MGFFHFIAGFYKNISYQNKLILSYLVFLLLPIVVLSLYSYRKFSEVNTSQSVAITEMYLQQAQTSLDYQLSMMANTAQTLAQQPTLKEIMDQDPAEVPVSQQYIDYTDIRKILNAVGKGPHVNQIRLYVDEDFIYSRNRSYTYNIMDIVKEDWMRMVNEYYAGVYISPVYNFNYAEGSDSPVARITSAIAPIRSDKNMNDIIGFVTVDMLEQDLHGFIEAIALTDNSAAYIVDGNREIICASGNDMQNYKDFLADESFLFQDHIGTSIYHDEYVIGVSDIVWNSWHIVIITPVKDFIANVASLRNNLIALAAGVGVIVYFIAFFYAKYSTRRIRGLANQMSVVEKGNFNVYCTVDSSDEIGELQSAFNTMLRKIQGLMKEQYYLGRNLKGTELKVLQAQINPHFLYNTMDLILWSAKKGNTEQVCDIVLKLSRFYRIALSRGSDFIPLEREIEHVRLYTELQNLRFDKKIQLETNMEPKVRKYNVMKLLLQPIVENAILHGIMNKDDIQGFITISAYLSEPDLCIEIKDNGIGMNHNQLMHLASLENRSDENSLEGSYGLQNIIQRLKVHYDHEASLRFYSTPGKGTTVVVKIAERLCRNESDFPS